MTIRIIPNIALKGQGIHIAQGIALGTRKHGISPCKGKSIASY